MSSEHPFGWGAPVKRPPWPALLKAATTLMPVDPSECRQHALGCVRLAQTAKAQKRGRYGLTSGTWLRFASDLEASECLLDEWAGPKIKSIQSRDMSSSHCKQCNQPLVEIDHWGERLMGCYNCNRSGFKW
jgi:hypothetical protein